MQPLPKFNNQNTEFFLQESKTLDGFIFDPNSNIWKFTDATNSKQFIFSELNILEDKLYGLKKLLYGILKTIL